jgi:hypothetical protein
MQVAAPPLCLGEPQHSRSPTWLSLGTSSESASRRGGAQPST